VTVAASIVLAAIVGGVIFVLLDSWQRRAEARSRASAPAEPEQAAWRPEPPTQPLPPEPVWAHWDAHEQWQPRREVEGPPENLWSGWARREQRRRYYYDE
jgi:hypothetical protein